MGSDAVVLTTGSLAIAARTSNTRKDATARNGGGPSALIGGTQQSYDAAVLSFRLKSKVKGKLRCGSLCTTSLGDSLLAT